MKRRLLSVSLVLTILVVVGGVILWSKHQKPAPRLAASVTRQISFVIYLPGTDWQLASAKSSYRNSVLSLQANQLGTNLNISEQASPNVFSDVPDYYPSLITKLNEYTSLGTINGTAYLTRPKELNGQQEAVLNNDGTLLFVHPNHNLSDDDWRRFFNDLVTTKPS